ncbi:endolytic transglycosylase MltG [Nafulsella turpanensis]|uniref:endolytic transglycosylase MltG n=1 Tax=Nafulsella turpanensis TaxID=1265690 RepID=UPI00034B6E79|nr:endolytic transglycosylase MltG [Nafulsella turpanensis]
MKNRKILLVGLVVFSVLLTSFSFYAYQIVFTPNILVEQEDRSLIIQPEESFEELRKRLHKEGIIQDMISFSFLSKLMEYPENVKPGHYVLKKDMSNLEAIRLLRSGMQTPVNVTFNNVRTKELLAKELSENLMAEEEELYRLMHDSATLARYGFDSLNVVSMFIPNTYEFFWTTSAEEVFERMHEEYEKFWNEERRAKAEQLGLNPKEVSVLASIVKAETSKRDEMPRVAGVYLNRLDKNMRLEADPTLIFAANDFTIRRVLNEHKKIDSPYNTYMYAGLPPGPINVPSITAIDAVLNAEDHRFLFFCAREDFSGYHNFAATYREHLRNARKWQQALNKQKVYR